MLAINQWNIVIINPNVLFYDFKLYPSSDSHRRSDLAFSSTHSNDTATTPGVLPPGALPPASLNGYVYDPQYFHHNGVPHTKVPLLMNNNGGVKLHNGGHNGGHMPSDPRYMTPLTPCYETLDGMAGDLSEFLDCSVVDSGFVTEYCHDNLQVGGLIG